MNDTQKRIKNPLTIERLGKQMRFRREQARIAQGKVRGMRQATVSKIENGGDVTLDTFITYAASLGLDLALVPVGQAMGAGFGQPLRGLSTSVSTMPAVKPVDLLSEFADLMDEE